MGAEIWILAEQKEGKLQDISLKLLSEASRIAARLGGEVCAVIAGENLASAVEPLREYGSSRVYLLDAPRLKDYCPEYYVSAISQLIKEVKPEVFIFGATILGRDLAPRLAAKLGVGLVSNCTHLEMDQEGVLYQSKPVYGGKVSGTFICPQSRLQIVTLAPENLEKRHFPQPKKAEVITFKPKLEGVRVTYQVTGSISPDPRSLPLEQAEVIVSGGRGVGSKENFKLLKSLAERLGGTIACSRMALDEGWLSRDRLVGSTGSFVSPRAYIACGISGASQHLMGMRDSGFIVAINKDPKASIFNVSDVAVVGDLLEIIPRLITALRTSDE